MPKKHHNQSQSQQSQPTVRKPAGRAVALDALRGLAILAMVLSGLVPALLPAWMYHGQDPPPTHITNTSLPGITWVDLVFPFFLFSMGAAIPLALGKRLEKGRWWSVIPGILWRGALLAAFAYFRDHVDPFVYSPSPARFDWQLALLGFACVFPIWLRLPPRWPLPIQWLVRVIGWGLALLLLVHYRYPDHQNLAFNGHGMVQWLQRVDIIILVLANVSVAGSLIWLCTRNAWFARLAPVGLMVALKISSTEPGWARVVWNASSMPWLYRMEFMKYLVIILPGTIVGDMLVAWLKTRDREHVKEQWPVARMVALTILLFSFAPECVYGLHERFVVESTLIVAAMLLAGALLTMRPQSELDRMLARLFQWGAYWLILGLVFEPYEGGIKKSFATMSYFFVTLGLAILTLAAFTILTERLKGTSAVALLTANGQNPLLAYVGISNFIVPIAVLSGLNARLDQWMPTQWLGALHAAIITLLLALAVAAATRYKVFVRA